ncbi:hypothetical protein IWQ62_004093 [Dispira parvispora]|uniref:SRP54-type proteins GTP-binding domain-containing protein n=1 Tax=Dispira parvispora TaxID=1520584 RepID=A0A9W8E5X8_9FUNG|nr:hypothetical protein IWQ62_004093 [Dispira parvispora]
MLDLFMALTRGGVVLWSKAFTNLQGQPINDLIEQVLIGQHQFSDQQRFTTGPYDIQWSLANEHKLVFVAVYQHVLQLTYVPELLHTVQRQFCNMHNAKLNNEDVLGYSFDTPFMHILDTVEMAHDEPFQDTRKIVPTDKSAIIPSDSDDHEVPSGVQKVTQPIRSRKKPGGRRDKVTPGPKTSGKKSTKKELRVWDDSRMTNQRMKEFDYSNSKVEDSTAGAEQFMDEASMGQRTQDGMYTVQDLVHKPKLNRTGSWDILETDEASDLADASSTPSGNPLVSFFKKLTSSKTLSEDDLAPVMAKMREHLIAKNVASDISDHICQSVTQSMVKQQVGAFQSIKGAVKQAMETTLQRILTPNTSVDLLRDIQNAQAQQRPYSIVFVGVNGVGKSTNLSKVCFWLLQNKLKVLIAACDTFRSGAVEQLRVHARNLKALSSDATVDIFERGYGKDSAGIARDAIQYAKNNSYDVVLVDTAGRMQDNEPLMRALSKLVAVNDPDKIIFVGEALVGNEAVDQLKKFNQALRDYSGLSKPRHIDGIILTKFDTIDDKVGAALSMTYTTGQPILFVGTGQTYTDLKNMRVDHVVQALLED